MPAKIIGLTYVHENQALAMATQCWCERFQRETGADAIVIDLKAIDGMQRLQTTLAKGDIDFCFGVQGVGSRLTIDSGESLWTHYQTPFLGFHYDSPSCNIYNHFCDSLYVANLYGFGCLFEIQQGYVKNAQINERIPYEVDPAERRGIPFKDRPIRMSFLKSGKSPSTYADYLNQIKPPLREALWAAIEKAEKNENLLLCELISNAFKACGFDPTQHWAEFWGFADWIDNYIRSKRAADMVNWLKFQDGAVIIGEGWDFIDKTGAKAIFKRGIPAEEGISVYAQSQFVFNTSPYGSDIIHERVIIGLSDYCCVVSDTNAWWDEHFANVPALYRFRWGTDYGPKILEFINDPTAADKAQTTIGFHRIRETLGGHKQIPQIMKIAKKVRPFAQQKSANPK